MDWHAIHGSQAETEKPKVSTPQGSKSVKRGNRSSVDCFNCGKIGHRAVDCWSRRRPFGTPAPANPPGDNTTSKEVKGVKPIICFNCREVGHKSPDCPKPKKGRKTEAIKTVRERGGSMKAMATYGEHEFLIPLDTGATVTIIPKEFVKAEDITGVTTCAKCSNAAMLILQEANVKLSVGNMILHRRVGVAPSEEIESEALLSFDLHNPDERQQLQDLMAHHDATKAKRCSA